jgi:hypothetical protein
MKAAAMRHDTYDAMHHLLKNIKLADPDISEAEAKEQLWEELQHDAQRYFRLLYDNWFNVNWPQYRAEVKDGSVAVLREYRQSRRNRGAKRKVVAKRTLERAAPIVLMNLPTPGGKALRDCTGAECTRFGGWFKDIGKAIKPNEKVGKALSETDLQNLYGRNQPRVA